MTATVQDHPDYVRLFRHGQFYIGPATPPALATWPRWVVDEGLQLAAHPALNVAQVQRGASTLTLIGYLIDPERPGDDDATILAGLLDVPGFAVSPFDKLDRLGGRWLLILRTPEDIIAFADPAGLRQMFHARTRDGATFQFASEPGMLGETGGFELDPGAQALQESPAFERNAEYWWPGDASPFEAVRRLPASFFVSLRTGRIERYWPRVARRELDSESALQLLATRLPAMMNGIARRGSISVTITAGLDSRMVLAASRDFTSSLRFVTVQQAGMAPTHADLEIPRRLARRMGFEHRVIVSANSVREPVHAAYRDSILFFHEKWLRDAQAILDAYDQQTMAVVGSMAEVGRLLYPRAATSAEALARAAKFGEHPFAVAQFRRWLETLQDPCGYSVPDLFYLEQRAARWMATSQLEFGLVWKDVFAPFNSREILSTMLAVPEEPRRPPESVLFRELIRRLQPEALSEPINPHKVRGKRGPLRRLTKRLRRRLGRLLGGTRG